MKRILAICLLALCPIFFIGCKNKTNDAKNINYIILLMGGDYTRNIYDVKDIDWNLHNDLITIYLQNGEAIKTNTKNVIIFYK